MHTDPEKQTSMPQHPVHQSLSSSRGFTLPEMIIGIFLMVMLLSVINTLLKAATKTYLYSLRQTNSLAMARRALDTGNPSPGMAWQVRQSSSAAGLSSSQLSLNTPNGQSVLYRVDGLTLNLVQPSVVGLTDNVSSLQIGYYNLDTAGHIMVSISSALVQLVMLQIQCTQTGGAPSSFYEVEHLRNGQ